VNPWIFVSVAAVSIAGGVVLLILARGDAASATAGTALVLAGGGLVTKVGLAAEAEAREATKRTRKLADQASRTFEQTQVMMRRGTDRD